MKKVKKTFSACWLTTCDVVILCLYDPSKTLGGALNYVTATIQDPPIAGVGECTYEFCYDEALLANPSVGLVTCDIKAVEKLGCLVDYMQRFTLAPVSIDPGNLIAPGTDGKAFLSCGGVLSCVSAFQIDCTLGRDINGILGAAKGVEPVGGHLSLAGYDVNGCGIVIPEISVMAGMSGSSSTYNVGMTPTDEHIVDYDLIERDPLGLITPGAAWHLTIPVTGRYHFDVAALFSNDPWGGFGPSNFAGLSIFLRINALASVLVGGSTVWDRTQTQLAAPQVKGSKILSLVAGNTVKVFVSHSDNQTAGNPHKQVAHPLTNFNMFRIP